MKRYISQSIRIKQYLIINLLCVSSLYSMQTPYTTMPNAPAQSVCISVASENHQLAVEPLSRSASHGNFQSNKKKHKRNSQVVHGSAQTHDNSARTINDYSINVATTKARACNNKLAVGVSSLMLAGLTVVIYLQVRITNQAQQIGANTASLDGIGDQLDKTGEQIAGGITTLDNILGLLLNLTRKG